MEQSPNNQSTQSNNQPNDQQQVPGQEAAQVNGGEKQPSGGAGKIVLIGVTALLVGFGAGMLTAESVNITSTGDDGQQEVRQEEETTALEVPDNAEVINECAPRRGKQFVSAENIPFGPVYGVWEGEITSVEYMLGKEDFLGGEDYLDVDLMGAEYDHMNVGLLSEGHSGYQEPHYHVDLFTISHEKSEQITCE